MLISQPSLLPTRKVAATGIAGAITVGIIAAVDFYHPGLGAMLSPTITAAVAAVAAFIGGYFARSRI